MNSSLGFFYSSTINKLQIYYTGEKECSMESWTKHKGKSIYIKLKEKQVLSNNIII